MILFGSRSRGGASMTGAWAVLLCAFMVKTVYAGTPLEATNITVPSVVKDNPPIKFAGDGWGVATPGTFGCSGPFDPSISAVGATVQALNTSTPGDNATFTFQGTAIYANLKGDVFITVTIDGTVYDDIDISGLNCNQTLIGFNATNLSATGTHTIQLSYNRRKYSPASGAPASFYVYSLVYTSVPDLSGGTPTTVEGSATTLGTGAPSSTSTKPSEASRTLVVGFHWMTIIAFLISTALLENFL